MNPSAESAVLKTERLLLEPLTPDHADVLFEPFRDPDLYHYIFWGEPESVAWLRERYQSICRGKSKDGKQTWLNWASKSISTGEYVGFYETTIEADKAMLAYYTFRNFQRFGFAKEGILAVMEHVQNSYPIKNFVLEMDTRNRASVRLAESLGFAWEKTTNHACELDGVQSHEFTYRFDLEPKASFLKRSDIKAYLSFWHDNLPPRDFATKVKKFRDHFSRQVDDQERIVVVKQGNHILGTAHLLRLQPRVFAIAHVRVRSKGNDAAVFDTLIRFATNSCSTEQRLEYRLVESRACKFQEAVLTKRGFHYKHQRTEFRKSISELPDELGTPFEWEAPESLDPKTIEMLGDILQRAAHGDPDFDHKDKGSDLIKADMVENGLTSGPSCIHLGKIGDAIAAIVIAQVDQSTGWSRITYMGLLPEFRRKGLGKWVHRHGFVMMKQQGGKLYHGGTLTKNRPMMKLFERHGCEKYRTMQEWELRF